MTYLPLIIGLEGQRLKTVEQEILRRFKPLGVILFTRNCRGVGQVQELCWAVREALENPSAPIFIDQEGGAVTRLKPPVWPAMPWPAAFGPLFQANPKRAKALLQQTTIATAASLREIGVNVVTSPCVDILYEQTHPVLRQRIFSAQPMIVEELGQTIVDAYEATGITPILKHFPGHGPAKADSHKELPRIEKSLAEFASTDTKPYVSISCPALMTAHLACPNLDSEYPSSQSKKTLAWLRETLHFKGWVVTDCITMHALKGSLVERAVKCLQAGNNLVLCSQTDSSTFKEICATLKKYGFVAPPIDFFPTTYQALDGVGHKIDYHVMLKAVAEQLDKEPMGLDFTENWSM